MSSRRKQTGSRTTFQSRNPLVLPAVGAGALILIVAMAIVFIGGAGSGDDGDDDQIAAELTPTPGNGTPSPEDELVELTPTPDVTQDPTEATPTPDGTPDAELTPEEEPTPVPTPAEPPLVGDFGEIPAGDIPSGSPAEAMNLQYNLDMSLQNIPRQASVYQIERRQWTETAVQELAAQLDIDGEVVDQGGGSFRVEGSSRSVYINPTMIQFIQSSPDDDIPELPADEQLIQMSRSWLSNNGLVGADLGPGQVLDRDTDRGTALVLIKPVEPAEIISATPSAGVTIRGDGVVKEAMINWPSSLTGSTYGLRTPEQLWQDASQGRHFVEISVSRLPADFQGRSGTVTVTGASIAYTVAGSSAGTQYLVPVVAFSGSASIEGTDQAIPVRIFVQAVAAQALPRG